VPSSKLALHAFPVKDKNSILTPTVTGGCAADPTCDSYNIFPAGPLAQVVRGACDDLLHGLHADQQSFEGGTTGVHSPYKCTVAVSSAAAWHGTKSMKVTLTDLQWSVLSDVTTVTAAGGTYTFSGWFKAFSAAEVGKKMRVVSYDNVTGLVSSSNLTLSALWLPLSITATFNAGSASRRFYIYYPTSANLAVGESLLADGLQCTATAYPLWFVNGSGTAMTQTVPIASLPWGVGLPFTLICYFLPPWKVDDSLNHYLLDTYTPTGGDNGVRLVKGNANALQLICWSAGSSKYTSVAVSAATNWPAGVEKAIMASIDSIGNQTLYLGRTAATTVLGTSGRETALHTHAFLGSAYSGASTMDCPTHYAFFNRVITPTEWLAICDLLGVA
jgi:hypothetical protein